jgi:hypothetical protein
MLVAESLVLLVDECGDGAFGDAGSNESGELLDGHEVDLRLCANLLGNSLGSMFPPSEGQLMNLSEKLRWKCECGHDASCLRFTTRGWGAFHLPW